MTGDEGRVAYCLDTQHGLVTRPSSFVQFSAYSFSLSSEMNCFMAGDSTLDFL